MNSTTLFQYLQNFLGLTSQSGTIEYYLILISALQIVVAVSVALIRWLTAPIDILTGRVKK